MTRNWTPLSTTALVTGVAVTLALGVTVAVPIPLHSRPGRELASAVVMVLELEVFFTTLNLLLLFALAGVYANLYRDLPNKYTLSLVVLSLILLLYAFTSNPFVHILFGFRPRPNVGAFTFLPDLFVGVAIVVLLYQSQT